MANVLKVLLRKNHLQTYEMFRVEYNKVARKLGSHSVAPSRSQFHRWLAGDIKNIPQARHCQILAEIFPDVPAEQLFVEWDESAIGEPESEKSKPDTPRLKSDERDSLAGVRAIYTSRSDFVAQVPVEDLLDGAEVIEVSGLSLNLICQQYSTNRLAALIEQGATVECLFLDPESGAMKDREREEGYGGGELQALTAMNIDILRSQVQEKLSSEAASRLRIAVYDQVLRFNLTFVDQAVGVFQPYGYALRGLEAPTFFADRTNQDGLFESMYRNYEWLKERSTEV